MKKLLSVAVAMTAMAGSSFADGHAANIIVVTHGSDADGF